MPDGEDPLHATHALLVYRGVHRPLPDTLEAIRDDLLAARHADEAWSALVRLARQQGPDADAFLAGQVAAALANPSRAPAHAALMPLLLAGPCSFLGALAARPETRCRLLALACLGRAAVPFDRPARRAMRELLLDRTLPVDAQADALAALLPRLEAPLARDFLRRFIAGLGRTDAAERVQLLAERTGPLPVLQPLIERLQAQVRMHCPRCGVQLRRLAMERHLWEEHRLVLDGMRVRDAWELIADWLDAGLIERCWVAASNIDAETGPDRLRRLLLARGQGDAAARQAVLAQAREQHAACCPWCYALVATAREVPALQINHRAGRLSAGGYSVEVDERHTRSWLEVRTPHEIVYQGQEPDHPWTPWGAAEVYALPFVILAVLAAFWWPKAAGGPLVPVIVLLTMAAIVALVARVVWRWRRSSVRRVVDYAWSLLVPRLHVGGYIPADSAFLAGLARLHGRLGVEAVPEAELDDLVRRTEQAVESDQGPAGHLAALVRLAIDRGAAAGKDPVLATARWLARCFEGRLSLAFAQEMLHGWHATWWSPATRARLRVLLCDRAFEAGFEVRTLLDAGQNAPDLGAILHTDAPRSLAGLRLLWSLRPSMPWDRLGAVRTAFELASEAERSPLWGERGDVLLWQDDPDTPLLVEGSEEGMAPARICLTLAGVWVQGVPFSIPPRVFEVRLKSAGCEMRLGQHVFRSPIDLEPLSRRLERWFRYAFHEFLPQVDRVLTWQSPDRAAILRTWGAVPCPECARYLLPRVGEVGIALDETVSKAAAE